MLQGFVMEAIGQLAGERFQDVSQMQEFLDNSRQELAADQTISPSNRLLMNAFLGSVESMVGSIESLQTKADDTSEAPNNGNGFQFANIESLDVSRVIDPNSQAGQLSKMQSKWDISFPQAMMWGVMGCVAGFAISIARERSQGTMMRLQVAPVSKFEILAGKAVACFMTVILVIVVLTTLGVVLGMQPKSYGLLAVASFCVAFCFVGIMMVMSVLGRTEASVNGAGWAINMVMAMLGGAMIPVMFMPAVIKQFSVISPIKWGILSLEGAIWREFSFAEMLLPCAIMLGVGAAGLVIGTVILSRSES
jgi:ABC-2 type transport system permease protein